MVDYFAARGGELRLNARLQSIVLDAEGAVDGFRLTDGATVRGDLYVSAMPGVRTDTSPVKHRLLQQPEEVVLLPAQQHWKLLTVMRPVICMYHLAAAIVVLMPKVSWCHAQHAV
jgi:hypothetical protein